MISSEVTKAQNETNPSLLRRFSKKVKDLGTVKLVRSLRYNNRTLSPFKKKKNALNRIAKREEMEKLKKLGKIRDGFRK